MKKICRISFLITFFVSFNVFSQVHYPGPVDITGNEEIVFDYSTDACDIEDIPDGTAQAFRDIDGKIQLIASHKIAYRMIGDNFNSLVRDCSNGPVFTSHNSSSAGSYNNQEWLAGVYTPDGKTVYSIVHNEYKPEGDIYWQFSWYNTLTFATSTDTGRSYSHATPPNHFLAGIPYKYSYGYPMGIFGGSRPVYNPNDSYYYVLVHLESYPRINPVQDWGVGVIRTQTLDDPDSWRGWNGEDFSVQFVDPYNETVTNPDDHFLHPVSQSNIGKMCESLTYNTYFNKFMVVGFHNKRNINTNITVHGFYYSLSDDLINWSSPILVYESPKTGWEVGGIYYPAIIDHSDTTRNYQRPGRDAYLYFTKWNSDAYNRDLVRVPIRFNDNIVSSFTVNSTGDLAGEDIGNGTAYTGDSTSAGDPEVTLRSAMHEALASPDPDYVFTINFDISGDGPHVINVGGFLPEPERPIIIDGFSQSGASPNTNALNEGNNAVIKIELDGSGSGGSVGFNLYGGDAVIKGLAIHGFGSGIQINDIGECNIQGCYLGTDAFGAVLGDEIGITINNSSNNIVGGTDPANFNVITGEIIINEGSEYNEIRGNYIGLDATGANTVGAGGISIRNAANNVVDSNVSSGTYRGVEIRGNQSQQNSVTNNFIGTDKTGVNPMSTGLIGVYVSEGARNNFIGKPDNGNVIGSWQYRGVVIDSAFSNKIQGNWIGTDQGAATDLGNLNEAIHLINDAADNFIGGEASSEGNIIAYNNGIAVRIGAESGGNVAITGNAILGNQIFYNGYGIDIDPAGVNENDPLDTDTGPNNLQNFPKLTSIDIGTNDTHIEGFLQSAASTSFRIEFFANDDLDQNNLGQGQEFIGYKNLTTDASGSATIDVHFATEITPGYYVTATATDPDYNTSEFSNPVRATSDIYFPDINVSPTTLTFSVNPTQMLDENITIENTGNLSLDWTAATSAYWIRLDKESGTLNASSSTLLNVTVNPEGMQAGTHSEIITITSTDPDEATIEISVSMTVNGYAEAVITPDSMEVFAEPGSSGTDTLFVSNTGTTLLEYYLHTSSDYVNVEPTWGRVLAGGTDTVIVTVNADTLDYGTYFEWVRVDPVSDQQSITVPLDVRVAILKPHIDVSLDSISAVIILNGSEQFDLIIENQGSELLTLAAFCNDGWVIPNPDTCSIEPGGKDTIVVTLDVTGVALGAYATNLWLYNNDPINSRLGIPVSVNIIEPGPRMSISPVSFNITVAPDITYQDSIWITNNGTAVLHYDVGRSIDWIDVSDTMGVVQANTTSAILLYITTSGKLGQYSEYLRFTSVDAIDNSLIDVTIDVNVVQEPDITVIPDSIHVTLAQGQIGTATFVIRNDGSANLEISQVGNVFTSNWLSPEPRNPGSVAPGDSVVITVNISGNVLDIGDHPGMCFVNSNDPDEPVVEIPILVTITEKVLQPAIMVVPETLEYSLLTGSTHTDTIMIYNLGDAELNWSLGNQTTWLNYNLAAGVTAASDSTELIITIDTGPLSALNYVDTLTFMSNDPEIPFLNIPVSLELVPHTGIDVANFMPDEYMLFRNYPNPFNPTTLIQYYVPEESLVEIKIFDFLGSEVKTLMKDRQTKQFYRVHWDGTNNIGIPMPSGMYFFRMVAKSPQKQYVKTRKMILLH
ncbi:T9SS type A sorting domain-containing protein [bacterium]|nr:T9SS type A sorting domain-containing protein [bacterium]